MVPMGLKGVYISNLHPDHIYLAHAHERAFISRNREVLSLYINSMHILAKSSPQQTLCYSGSQI